MEKKFGSNLVLGIFVLVASAIFLLLVFNMGGGQGLFSSYMTLNARFPHVKGLHGGSEVTLSGLRVGTVQGITVAEDGSRDLIVNLKITSKVKEKIRQDSEARVVTQGMLGDKYIELTIGTPDLPALKDGDQIKSAEVQDIFMKSTGLVDELKEKLGKNGELDQLLKNLNRAAENIANITAEAQKNKGMVYELTKGTSGEKLNRSMAHLESILKKVDQGEGTMGALINDPTVYEDLKSVMGGAKRSTILKYFMKQFMDSNEKGEKQPAPKAK